MGAQPDFAGCQAPPSQTDSLYALWGALLPPAPYKAGTQPLMKSQNQNSTLWQVQHLGTSQEEAEDQHGLLPLQQASIYYLPIWKKPVQSEKNDREQCSEEAPDSCGAHTEPQPRGASIFLPRFKQWHQAIHKAERCWASQEKLRSLGLMCFSPAFSHNLQCYYSDAQHQRI